MSLTRIRFHTGIHDGVLGTEAQDRNERHWDICDLLDPSLDTVRPISPAVLRVSLYPDISSSSLSPTPIPRPHVPPVVLNSKYFNAGCLSEYEFVRPLFFFVSFLLFLSLFLFFSFLFLLYLLETDVSQSSQPRSRAGSRL